MNLQEELFHYSSFSIMLVLHLSFYVMGKALSGELSCMLTGIVVISNYSRTSMAREHLLDYENLFETGIVQAI